MNHPLRLALLTSLAAALAAMPPDTALELGAGHRLTATATASGTDAQGLTHTRFRHSYLGLPVWSSDALIHSGPGAPPPSLPLTATPEVALLPTLAAADAQAAVCRHLGRSATLGGAETVLYPHHQTVPAGRAENATQVFQLPPRYALAYLIRADDQWDYLVDAHSGAILHRVPLEHRDVPAKGVGNTLYSGKVTLDITAFDGGFKLLDTTRTRTGPFKGNAVTDLGHTASFEAGAIASLGPESGGVWGNGQAEGIFARGPVTQTIAADAAFGLQTSWDYFQRIHGYNGWDGNGTGTFVRIHYLDISAGDVDNAAWNTARRAITIEDPYQFWPRSSLRTLAHEYAHGVNQGTANLVYEGEAGGLNEANSDIFGALITAFQANGAATRIGEGGAQWTITAISRSAPDSPILQRSMIRPSDDGESRDAWSSALAGLEPHHASGPMNRAFYFLSQGASASKDAPNHSDWLPEGMTGIGNDKAARIWFSALHDYLGAKSTYLDARQAAGKAAVQLFGQGSAEQIAVHKAFGAIAVGDPEAALDDFEPPTIQIQAQAGPALTLLADARDNDRVASVLWSVDGFPIGQSALDPFTLKVDAGRLLANGGHQASALALDPSGNQGASQPAAFTLANPYQQLLRDPGLELDAADGPWGPGVPALAPDNDTLGLQAHGGARYALFWQGNQVLSQKVTVPAGAAETTLRLWARITGDPDGPKEGPLRILVRSVPADPTAAPEVLATVANLSNADAWDDWLPWTFDLSRFAGQTVELRLELQNATPTTRFRIDDLALVSGAEPVEAAITPPRIALYPGQTSVPLSAVVFGSSNQTVTWSLPDGGSFDGSRFTAPAQPGAYHVLATPQADPATAAVAAIQVLAPVRVQPARATLEPGASLPFTLQLAPGVEVDLAVEEGPQAGTILRVPGSASASYTAPVWPGSYHLEITDRANPANQAVLLITVVEPFAFTINPTAQTLATGSITEISASSNGELTADATFSVLEGPAGGSLRPDRESPDLPLQLYTAPDQPGTYHVLATSTINPRMQSVCTFTVPAGMVVQPARVRLGPGQKQAFSAFAPNQKTLFPTFTWSAAAGSITRGGTFTAPDTPGTYTVRAELGDGSGLAATATVLVALPDPDGDGQTSGDFGDLAVLADDYGSTASADPADLNGDGVVDDVDVAAGLAAFETPAATQQASRPTAAKLKKPAGRP